jgi:predicted nucleotidyltransferase
VDAPAIDLEQLRTAASEFPDARLVVLFGSIARGTPASWSDADVGVLGLSFWRGLEVGVRIGGVLGREPHVVDLDAASTWLRFRVAREGILLREAEPAAWASFQADAALQWFDLQPIVELCAEGARRALRREPSVG